MLSWMAMFLISCACAEKSHMIFRDLKHVAKASGTVLVRMTCPTTIRTNAMTDEALLTEKVACPKSTSSFGNTPPAFLSSVVSHLSNLDQEVRDEASIPVGGGRIHAIINTYIQRPPLEASD